MLADKRADALTSNFLGPMAVSAESQRHSARPADLSRFRRQPAAGISARDRAVRRQHHARRPQRARSHQRRLHFRQRAPRPALRHSECLRRSVPQGADPQSGAPRPAGTRQRADGLVLPEPHFAGAARQMGADEYSGHAAAASSAECSAAEGNRLRHHAAADGRASRQPGLRAPATR